MSQLSLMPAFGEIEDPKADLYNAAFDAWQNKCSQFATLERYTASMTSIKATHEQRQALIIAVGDDANYRKLQRIDLICERLTAKFRRMVFEARMAWDARQHRDKLKASKVTNLSLEQQKQEQKAADEAKYAELLQDLETREELLSIEKEYENELAAKRSVYCNKAKKFADIKPVITRKAKWHGTNEFDERGDRIGVYVYTYILTFELINGEQTNEK